MPTKGEDITSLGWNQGLKGYVLTVFMLGGTMLRFTGIEKAAQPALESFANALGKSFTITTMDTSGRTSGEASIKDGLLQIGHAGKKLLDLKVSSISRSEMKAKTDVVVSFIMADDIPEDVEELIEMRLYAGQPEEGR